MRLCPFLVSPPGWCLSLQVAQCVVGPVDLKAMYHCYTSVTIEVVPWTGAILCGISHWQNKLCKLQIVVWTEALWAAVSYLCQKHVPIIYTIFCIFQDRREAMKSFHWGMVLRRSVVGKADTLQWQSRDQICWERVYTLVIDIFHSYFHVYHCANTGKLMQALIDLDLAKLFSWLVPLPWWLVCGSINISDEKRHALW